MRAACAAGGRHARVVEFVSSSKLTFCIPAPLLAYISTALLGDGGLTVKAPQTGNPAAAADSITKRDASVLARCDAVLLPSTVLLNSGWRTYRVPSWRTDMDAEQGKILYLPHDKPAMNTPSWNVVDYRTSLLGIMPRHLGQQRQSASTCIVVLQQKFSSARSALMLAVSNI